MSNHLHPQTLRTALNAPLEHFEGALECLLLQLHWLRRRSCTQSSWCYWADLSASMCMLRANPGKSTVTDDTHTDRKTTYTTQCSQPHPLTVWLYYSGHKSNISDVLARQKHQASSSQKNVSNKPDVSQKHNKSAFCVAGSVPSDLALRQEISRLDAKEVGQLRIYHSRSLTQFFFSLSLTDKKKSFCLFRGKDRASAFKSNITRVHDYGADERASTCVRTY